MAEDGGELTPANGEGWECRPVAEEDSVKLFVGQIPKHMTEAQLLAMFKEVAHVDEVNIIKDRVSKASRGCCFLICPSTHDADKTINAWHNKKTLPGASSPLQVKYADGELKRLEHKLFIGMLPKNISDVDISDLFSNYGKLKDLQILRGSQQTSKGCAFLKYETKDQAQNAIEALNGKHRMEGSSVPLVVKWADTEKERQARRAQKAQSQSAKVTYANILQQPSLYGTLPMGYIPSYNGFGYQAPGYSLMQYPLTSMQNQASFHSTAPSTNNGNPLGRTSTDVSSGAHYPFAYSGGVINNTRLLSPGIARAVNSVINPALSPDTATGPGGQIEGPPGANLFIYHIPQEYGDLELANAFQGFGRVLSAKVFVDKATGISKCFGFVSYDSPSSAQAAINLMNGFQLGGKKLKVQLKRDNKQKLLYGEHASDAPEVLLKTW